MALVSQPDDNTRRATDTPELKTIYCVAQIYLKQRDRQVVGVCIAVQC